MAPKLAAHHNAINLNEALFRRVEAVWNTRAGLTLTPEQARVLERHRTAFRRAGAHLEPATKKRLAQIGGVTILSDPACDRIEDRRERGMVRQSLIGGAHDILHCDVHR